jgi:proteasome alpha subunit
VTMPFYVSPEQSMKDKADYARKRITDYARSGLLITCEAGILFVTPNSSRALRKFGEIYDRIAFAAVGRYPEFENLRKAGIRYADLAGYQYDRQDVTAQGLANWYAQVLGTIFTESQKPYEVEIMVAEVGKTADDDQIYRITFDGSVTDERDFAVMGGQADRVTAALKDSYRHGMTLAEAFTVAVRALARQDNGERQDITAPQLEVALLDRGRQPRAFRRLTGPRLEGLLAEAISGRKTEALGGAAAPEAAEPAEGGSGSDSASQTAGDDSTSGSAGDDGGTGSDSAGDSAGDGAGDSAGDSTSEGPGNGGE